jgi:hypothetical protein
MGQQYEQGRNYDNGPERHTDVSMLSPYIRCRLITEQEAITTALTAHGRDDASKFIEEVIWRGYYKGWLERRPQIWDSYVAGRDADLISLKRDRRLRRDIELAETGNTGLGYFDSWAHELVETGYLHNHSRMWFASIWIFTLELPWRLGADFFYRHLLDGDAAANTLNWRWAAGLHTRGKTYLARPDNIRKYGNPRFQVEEGLAAEPVQQDEAPPPEPRALPPSEPVPEGLRLGLLITEEDLSASDWLAELYPTNATAQYFPNDSYEALKICPEVVDFRRRALSNLSGDGIFDNYRQLIDWAKQKQLDGIITAEPTTGHWPEILKILKPALAKENIELFTARHWWDETLFPHSTKGFFRFKQAIPDALEKLSNDRSAAPSS